LWSTLLLAPRGVPSKWMCVSVHCRPMTLVPWQVRQILEFLDRSTWQYWEWNLHSQGRLLRWPVCLAAMPGHFRAACRQEASTAGRPSWNALPQAAVGQPGTELQDSAAAVAAMARASQSILLCRAPHSHHRSRTADQVRPLAHHQCPLHKAIQSQQEEEE